MRPLVIILGLFLISISASAKMLRIQTTNEIFYTSEESILNGPDGFLKSAILNKEKLNSFLEDGSLFANVDKKSMAIALSYIRYGILDQEAINSSYSATLKMDLELLFPNLKVASTQKSSIWKCTAVCGKDRGYGRGGHLGYTDDRVRSKDHDIVEAWEKIVKECGERRGHLVGTMKKNCSKDSE